MRFIDEHVGERHDEGLRWGVESICAQLTELGCQIAPGDRRDHDQQELAESLLEQAREQGVSFMGPGGLLAGLTKTVLETALEAEITDHLGHDRHGSAERGNVRNGTRSKTVFTEVGPVEIDVPRDREGTFTPQIVKKRQRWTGSISSCCR